MRAFLVLPWWLVHVGLGDHDPESVLGGLVASFWFDWPLGPALCTVAALELALPWACGRTRV